MSTWKNFIEEESKKPYMKELQSFLQQERQTKEIFPASKDVFNAFKLTPYEKVRCIILGQDPYHSRDTAHGLAFSTKQSTTPVSLLNVFKEIKTDYFESLATKETLSNITPFKSNDLTYWTEQGVLLLNTIHTVEHNKPGSHKGKGWEKLTEAAILRLNDHPKKLVYMLWGNFAQGFEKYIDKERHLVLKAAHPAAEAYKEKAGFFGCKHFTQANKFIEQHNPIGYRISINWGIWT